MTAYAQLTVLEQLASDYSDFYKEAHGVRPHGVDVSDWTEEDFRKEFAHLGDICKENAMYAAQAEQQAILDFEAKCLHLMQTGAKDRATAIRWLCEAEGNGLDYLCYVWGLPFRYLTN